MFSVVCNLVTHVSNKEVSISDLPFISMTKSSIDHFHQFKTLVVINKPTIIILEIPLTNEKGVGCTIFDT